MTADTPALRELIARASKLPWQMGRIATPNYIQNASDYCDTDDDAALIVAAINALPALLDEIERLRGALKRIEDVGDGYGGSGTTGEGHAKCREIARLALAPEAAS